MYVLNNGLTPPLNVKVSIPKLSLTLDVCLLFVPLISLHVHNDLSEYLEVSM